MGDVPGNLVRPPDRHRYGPAKAAAVGVLTLAMCLTLAGAAPAPVIRPAAFSIRDMDAVGSPPGGFSWAPQPTEKLGLRLAATAGNGRFALHTAGGDRTFLPGVNLGSTTPGHQPGELSISATQYRWWFVAMGWLGIRVVRIHTIHPPAFYEELARHNAANPDRPLYLMQGVYLPDESYINKRNLYDRAVTTAFQREIADAAAAVSGHLTRAPRRGRASGTWNADVTPWLAGWIVGAEMDPYAGAASDRRNARRPGVAGRYFRSTPDATPTERWLAARMDELAGYQAGAGLGAPIAFVNWPTTDPLRHPEEPPAQEDLLQLDANHVRPTAAWPAGTFASYHAYPYYPDFQRHEPGLLASRYDGRPDPYPLTSAQDFGLVAMDAAGSPDAANQFLVDDERAWPARRVTARVDESYLRLRIALGSPRPGALTVGYDVLPGLTGPPPPGSADRTADAAFVLNLVPHTGQAYVRDQLDPMPLDWPVPASARGPAPAGWKRFELIVNRDLAVPSTGEKLPAELQNAGLLRYGTPAEDSRNLWYLDGDDLVVRVPWAMLCYADPSLHKVGVPRGRTLTLQVSPGVGVAVSASGTDQHTGTATWVNWNRAYYTERLKQGAGRFRDAALDTAR